MQTKRNYRDGLVGLKKIGNGLLVQLVQLLLLPLIGTISGILGPIGAIVGLFAKAVPLLLGLLLNPIFLKAMLAIGAGVLLYKGGEAIF